MKKLILLLCLLCALPVLAQNSKTFKVACLNIDGLPPRVDVTSITEVKLNPEGPQAEGTAKMSELVAQKGWDFFGISEAFNFNEEFISKIKDLYSTGTFRDAIPTKLNGIQALDYIKLSGLSVSEDTVKKSFDTDGLNILYKNYVKVSNEKMVGWKMRNGVTKNGADMLIDKGYRYYTVSLGAGLDIDVYLLHMDAETTERDNVARAVQIKQLVEAIKATDNKRPIIIMGDTNCRYTRDDLKGLLIDNINADPRFEIHDPWIDYMWDGNYPKLGSNALMVGQYGHQKGEVVDKIFYINNKDADAQLTAHGYLQDMDFTYPDGSEISDHFPIVIKFTIENLSESVAEGEDYFIRNVATKEYIAAGAEWGTRGVIARTGNRLTLKSTGTENTFTIGSTLHPNDAESTPAFLSAGLWMDSGTSDPFIFTRVKGTKYYTITNDGESLSYDSDKRLVKTTLQSDDPNQQWEVLKLSELTKELKDNASEANPMDATFFIKGANFSRNDRDRGEWKTQYNSSKVWGNIGGWGKTAENEKNAGISTDADLSSNYIAEMYTQGKKDSGLFGKTYDNGAKVYQKLSSLPIGKYKLSFQGFVRRSGNNDAFNVSINGVTCPIMNLSAVQGTAPNNMAEAATLFNTGACTHTMEFTVKTESDIELAVNRPNENVEVWVAFDNFVLTYLGPTDEDIALFNKVKAAIDDAQKKADEAGYSTYDNSVVEERYENRTLSGNGDEEVHMTYLQLANAARKQTGEMPVDMRYALLNNSFEMGNLTEWDASNATSDDVKTYEPASDDETYYVSTQAGRLTQTIQVTMPTGVYSLKAKVSPGAILVADAKESTPAEGDGEWIEKELKFIINKGTATVGVRCDGPFRADQFILSRISDASSVAGYELIELAMRDATERVKAMGSPYNDNWDLSKYQQIIDELSLEGDGTKEFYEIYGLLREQVYKQPQTEGVSYTNALINPSFEFGTTLGWDTQAVNDTGARECANETYTMQGSVGTYLFNTWDNGSGAPISQTIVGLPAGHYRVIATIGGDQDNYVFFEVNGQRSEAKKIERAKGIGEDKAFEFDVADGTQEVTITIVGGNSDGTYNETGGCWYKVDNVRLTRHGDTKVCFFYDRLQRAINRLNALAADLPDKYRVQWDPSDYQDLYDRHINGPSHDNITEEDDPMNGSNGVAEINDLYARFRALVFSQTETGADMTGAIGNQSFELGNLSFWNTTMEPASETLVTENVAPYTVDASELDGKYLFNSWQSGSSTPVTQTISTVPAGIYRLTAKVASDPGNRFYLAVNDTPGKMLTITKDNTHFEEISVEFEVTADEAGTDGASITIGLYPSAYGDFDPELNPITKGPWFKADNFRLQLIGRRIDIKWAMEYPEEGYGTIILPFDAEVPEDLEIHSLVKSKPSDALGDETYYQIAELAKRDKILANTPYIVTRKAATTKPEGAPQRRAAAAADANGVYTFSGITTHTQDTYESGFLTGSLVAAEPTEGDRHLMMNDGNLGFILHDNSDGQYKVEPYHAYISRKTIFTDGEGHDAFVSDVYFDEPETTVEWTMETALYGTIILPFDAEEPVTQGLIAYEITGLGDAGSYVSKLDNTEYEYQLINLTRVEDEIMKAYTPYLLFGSPTPEATAAEDDTADAPRTLTFKGKAADGTGATLENGLLKGVLTSGVQTAADDFILTYDNRNKEVFSIAQTPQTVTVNHAYIPQEKATSFAPGYLFFEAPTADDIQSGLQVVAIDSEAIVDVFSIDGITLRTGIEAAEALDDLTPGIYVLRTASGATLKVLKR